MKDILIFGIGEAHTSPYMALADSHVKHFTHNQIKAQPDRLRGYRPALIINLAEPYEELQWTQRRMAFFDTQIINLY